MAALADGTTHIHGVEHIRGHETDRIAALGRASWRRWAHACTRPGTA